MYAGMTCRHDRPGGSIAAVSLGTADIPGPDTRRSKAHVGLDAAFSGIRNIDRGMAHGVETVTFSDLAGQPDGTFARGGSGTRIQGGFYGPGHAEAAGIFEQSDIVGAFGAKRQ